MSRAIVLLAAVLAATTLAAHRQVFRSAVDIVPVDVVVTDKDDKPVTDLTRADFTITENKHLQRITDFQFVSVPVVHRTIDVTQPQPPEPDVATNIPPSPKSRLFAIVIDDLHIIEQDIIPLKAVMMDLIRALSPDDEVAVIYVGRSDLSQNFTTNTGRMLKTVNGVGDALGFGEDAGGVGRQSLNLARSAVFVLNNVATSLAGSGHSRRAIFYVSGGYAMTQNGRIGSPERMAYMTLRDELDAAYVTARRADVPIYTIDPRGLITATNSMRQPMEDPVAIRLARTQQDYLAEIADNTGGRVLMNRSNLTKAIDEIVQENGSYYLMSYSPDPVVHDGKYHNIDVKVTRPGLHVRARQGYVASAPGKATTDAKPTLDKAMSAGVNVSGLSLRALATPVAATAKGMNTVVTVEVTYPAPFDGSRKIDDQLQMTLVAMDPDGKIKAQSSQAFHFAGMVPQGQTAVTFLLDDAVVLPSQLLTLRMGLASQALGKAGTVQFTVDVAKPSDPKLQLSGVVITYASAQRTGILGAEKIKDLVPFQPATTRTFAETDMLRVFGRAFWGSKDTAVDVTLTIQGASRAPQVVHVAAAAGSTSHHEGAIDTTVPLTGLAPGSYTLRVEARLAGGQTAMRAVAFAVR